MILVLLLALSTGDAGVVSAPRRASAPAMPVPTTDVTAAAIQAVLEQEKTGSPPDTPIRVVDVGGYNVGIALIHHDAPATGHGASHPKVTEVFRILEGGGTLVTGGTLVDPKMRDHRTLEGPCIGGNKMLGGVRRKVSKGNMVIIPAGTVHGFTEIDKTITYLVIRIDPDRVITLK
jgi:mannose-6-phosphate isomerase-like protein (cupin superfamily)